MLLAFKRGDNRHRNPNQQLDSLVVQLVWQHYRHDYEVELCLDQIRL